MRILQVVPAKRGASGPTTVIIPLLQHLIERGHEVDVLSTFDSGHEVASMISKTGARFITANFSVKNIPHLLTNPADLFENTSVSVCAFDVAHVHGLFNVRNWLVSRALVRLQMPYVFSAHGNLMAGALQYHSGRKRIGRALLFDRIPKSASYLHALCVEESEHLQRQGWNIPIQVIPNGSIVPDYDQIGSKIHTGLRVLYLGRLDVYGKGIDIILAAVRKRLEALQDAGVRIELTGPFNRESDREYLEKQMMGLESVIQLTGPKYGGDKQSALEECDLFIHTSRYEGMPMAVLEAMGYGKPCLVTPGTNMAEIMVRSKAGFVCEGKPDDLGEALLSIAALPEERLIEAGTAGRDWCLEHHSWDKVAQSYEELYSRLAK